jgi:hypothetical protein
MPRAKEKTFALTPGQRSIWLPHLEPKSPFKKIEYRSKVQNDISLPEIDQILKKIKMLGFRYPAANQGSA